MTTTERETLDGRIALAREALDEARDYDPDGDIGDQIHEAADGCVPIYTYDVFNVMADPRAYTQDTSELGPGRDLEHTAQIAIYMALTEDLWEYARDQGWE